MKVLLLLVNNFSIFLVLQYIVMRVMEHRCADKLSGGFGGPFMYVLSPTSFKPKYRLIKMEKKISNLHKIVLNFTIHKKVNILSIIRTF